MPAAYRVVSTSRFARDYKALVKRSPQVISFVEAMVGALRQDPYNRSGHHNIKKLRGVERGEGQWRIAVGDYRIRYDIFGREVVLYSCKLRREAYR
jgi:mRNA-degrading endonuclease RelE of RelBE toxin-antitoxin system